MYFLSLLQHNLLITFSRFLSVVEFRKSFCDKCITERKYSQIIRKKKTSQPRVIFEKKKSKSGIWSEQETKALTTLLTENKYCSNRWAEVSQALNSKYLGTEKSASQCQQHWSRVSNPSIYKGKWKLEEEEMLLQLKSIHNNKWASMAREIHGRTDLSCSRHFDQIEHSLSVKWTYEEDEALLSFTRQFIDYIDWNYVSNCYNDSSVRTVMRWPIVCKIRYQEIFKVLLSVEEE